MKRETAHGRTVERDVFAMPAPPTLHGFANWPGLISLVMVITRRIIGAEETGYVPRTLPEHLAGPRFNGMHG